MGWGIVFSKVFEWIPGKKERYRSKINAIQKQMDAILQGPTSVDKRRRYDKLASQLRDYEEKLKNI